MLRLCFSQDHLVCYLPGTLLLGVHNGLSRRFASIAEQLLFTCYKMYETMPTGLSPEIVHFNISKQSIQDIYVKVSVQVYTQNIIIIFICTSDTGSITSLLQVRAHMACVYQQVTEVVGVHHSLLL